MMDRTRTAIIDMPNAGAALLDIFRRRPTSGEREEPTWSIVQAVRLLAALKYAPSIDDLLEGFFTRFVEKSPILWNLSWALGNMGQPALERLLEAERSTKDELESGLLRQALAQLEVKDERVFELLMRALDERGINAPTHLADYGDVRAVAPLTEALDRALERYGETESAVTFELAEAIEALGGELSDAQIHGLAMLATVDAALNAPGPAERPLPDAPLVKKEKRGRNDPCWCGSGKKYKKCHLAGDEGRAIG